MPPTYTVSYSRNDSTRGTAPVDGATYGHGAEVTVLGNTGSLVRDDYAFSGWNTRADGKGTTYAAGSTLIMGSSNVILYARWLPTFTITYMGNGNSRGDVPVDSEEYIEGARVFVSGNTGGLVRTNFAFSGWNTQADGLGIGYAPGASFFIGKANVTLFAVWVPTYRVTYDLNGGSGTTPSDPGEYLPGATVTVASTPTASRSGYIFLNWNTAANGSGASRAAGSTFDIGSANVTLYALWTPTYSVTYDLNGGSGTTPSDPGAYLPGATVTVASVPAASKSGFAFTEWNTAANGSGVHHAAGSTFDIGSTNVTLFAQWEVAYRVVYDANGAAGDPPIDPTEHLPGSMFRLLSKGTLIKIGLKMTPGGPVLGQLDFLGWARTNSGASTLYQALDTYIMPSQAITFFARWEGIE